MKGNIEIAFSIRVGSIFSPLARTMITLARPVITSSPESVIRPRSPVRKNPSSVKDLAVSSSSR